MLTITFLFNALFNLVIFTYFFFFFYFVASLTYILYAGHSANIFSAYFMPNTSDRIIISGAGDSEVRIFDCAKEAPLTNMYVCHEDQVRRLAIFKNNPNEFLTCSQDGNPKIRPYIHRDLITLFFFFLL